MVNSITDVGNILLGHTQDEVALTGCSVVLAPKGAVGGISQRGGAPGTRETDLLRPMHMVEKVHAIFLSGGSAYGLDVASGIMRWLEEHSIGFNTGSALVPIVPGAILYDLAIGNPKKRPDMAMGYAACQIATKDNFMQGNIGAGCGATVGKIFGIKNAMKSGLGTASIRLGNNVTIGALAAVNAFGDVVNKERKIIAGAQKIIKNISKNETIFADTLSIMNSLVGQGIFKLAERQNTIIGVVATNAKLTKDQANKFAESASDGITLSVQPAFTMLDGDTVFALSTGSKSMDINILCAYAPVVFADAIRNAVNSADPAGGLPSVKSLTGMNNDKNNS